MQVLFWLHLTFLTIASSTSPTPQAPSKMAMYNADEVIDLLEEDMFENEVITPGSDEEFEYW